MIQIIQKTIQRCLLGTITKFCKALQIKLHKPVTVVAVAMHTPDMLQCNAIKQLDTPDTVAVVTKLLDAPNRTNCSADMLQPIDTTVSCGLACIIQCMLYSLNYNDQHCHYPVISQDIRVQYSHIASNFHFPTFHLHFTI